MIGIKRALRMLPLVVGALGYVMPNTTEGKLPTLGWNTWNAYGHDINEKKVLDAAQAMVDKGLKDAGYNYVNVDDSWSELGRVNGRIVPDRARFPDGIDGLAKKIHDKGLKFGIYGDAGSVTCGWRPGSLWYEEIDAADWASWGIDYLKYDNCGDRGGFGGKERYNRMRDALANQTRPILFSICIWGEDDVVSWGNDTGISWRISDDIGKPPVWTGTANNGKLSIMTILNENLKNLDGVNFWGHNDADMLQIGNGLSPEESRSHFALWAAMKSPLIMGTDLDNLNKHDLDVLKNKYLLAFNQDDVFGAPAKPYNGGVEYWSGESKNGFLVLMLNPLDWQVSKTAKWSEIPGLGGGSHRVTNVWTDEDLGCLEEYKADVASHDTAVILVSKEVCGN